MNKVTQTTITERQLDPAGIDDTREKINEFMSKITLAKRQLKDGSGDGWIETTPEIVTYFNPNGLGGALYFIYSDIKVCEYGKKEACIEKMEQSPFETMHGTQDGIIDHG